MARSPTRTGLIDILPLAAPVVPFGLVLGIAINDSSMNDFIGWSSSWIIFAGAAQLTLIALLAAGSVVGAIVAALVVNTRHFMYSVALAETFSGQPRWFRWVGSYTLIDQTFAVSTMRLGAEPSWFRKYYLSASITIWSFWQIAVAVGIVVGGAVPPEWRLDFAVPILFVTLTVLGLTRRPAVVAAAVGFLAAALAGPLPNRLSILVGALAGVVAATLLEPADEGRAS